jgi:hypothetical protein
MKLAINKAALVVLALLGTAGLAHAGPIESACLKSARDAANRSLCSCIQQVADISLQNSDQNLVASFFKDPNKAETVRMSQSKRDDDFWARYINFGQQAKLSCAG